MLKWESKREKIIINRDGNTVIDGIDTGQTTVIGITVNTVAAKSVIAVTELFGDTIGEMASGSPDTSESIIDQLTFQYLRNTGLEF